MKIDDIIKKYSLQKHPEGGYFSETYRSIQTVIATNDERRRTAVTDIYYLLQKGQISRFHKVVSDEIWHFYEGDQLKLIKYDGEAVSEYLIGPDCDDGYKVVVEGGVYQAVEPMGEYALVGCTVAPGFEFEDFSFMTDYPSVEQDFRLNHPDYTYLI